MAVQASDDFTGTAGSLLSGRTASDGGTWTKHPSAAVDSRITAANKMRKNASNASLASIHTHSYTPPTAEYDVQMNITRGTTSPIAAAGLGPVGRQDTAALTMYHARYAEGTGWQLLRFVTGTATVLGTSATPALATGGAATLKLELRDAAKKVYVDGVELAGLTSTDNTITAIGRAGIRAFAGTGTLTDANAPLGDDWLVDVPIVGAYRPRSRSLQRMTRRMGL